MNRLFKFILSWLQKRCPHPPESVVADLREGDDPGVQVKWCRICGAYKVVYLAMASGGAMQGMVAPMIRAGGLLGSIFGGRPTKPPRELIDAGNPKFPIDTGWRTPEPRWEKHAIRFEADAPDVEGAL